MRALWEEYLHIAWRYRWEGNVKDLHAARSEIMVMNKCAFYL